MPWLGGFFDADGSVGLTRRVRKNVAVYTPIIVIGQSDRGLLEQIGSLIDATVYQHDAAGSSNSWGITKNRTSWQINTSNIKAVEIARKLVPFTISKRAELEAVIRYYDTYNGYTRNWRRNNIDEFNRRYEEEVEAAEACRSFLKQYRLNKDTI